MSERFYAEQAKLTSFRPRMEVLQQESHLSLKMEALQRKINIFHAADGDFAAKDHIFAAEDHIFYAADGGFAAQDHIFHGKDGGFAAEDLAAFPQGRI